MLFSFKFFVVTSFSELALAYYVVVVIDYSLAVFSLKLNVSFTFVFEQNKTIEYRVTHFHITE